MHDREYHQYCSGGFSPDDIVISGIAGRFPLCENIGELLEAMMNKKDLLPESNCRFRKDECKVPFCSTGVVSNIDKLDSEFFGMPNFIAETTDPCQKKLLEISYEAMVDAGYEPFVELSGSDVGVYTAIINEDIRNMPINEFRPSFAVGYVRSMAANRCSSIFNFKGPSYTVDSACSSSLTALYLGVKDLLKGDVDGVLVNSAQLCLNPEVTYWYYSGGLASETVSSRPFDAKANGIVRSEAFTAIFIQKASKARRAYATISSILQYSAGYMHESNYVPSWIAEARLFKDALRKSQIQANEIEFIESGGTGFYKGDLMELRALESVYCKNRKKCLYIGAVESHIGHTEASAGASGVIKAILALETGIIAPNNNFENPNPESPALVRGDIKVVTNPIPLTSKYIPVSSFGLGGSMAHAILKQNPIEHSLEQSNLPRLVMYPATSEKGVSFVFNFIKNNKKLTPEFFGLLNKLSFSAISSKPFRGYGLFHDGTLVKQINKCRHRVHRQIWFIVTGMGCQWPGMGLEMMKFDIFANSMKRSATILKECGLDLFELLQKDAQYLLTPRRITPAFVTIAAIQIALIDVLKALEIQPDYIIGHSTGELVCAYADGCCTQEQTILSAYWRGKAVEMAHLVPGAMAAVGLTWEEAISRCPEGVYAACHNADDSVTISGLTKSVEDFVSKLEKDGIFARVVDAYGYAFHCKHVWPASKILKSALLNIISHPKPRSERWLSTSYPEDEWEMENCKFAGPDYFVHNLMSTVRFNEMLKKIPKDAITIEIGPHFLLQSILKRSIGPEASYIGLMKKNDENNIGFFLESAGKLYLEGINPKIEYMYPPVKFPVPRNTPMISDLIKWDHSHSWHCIQWNPNIGVYFHLFDISGSDSYLLDHFIDGKSLFPATGYLFLAWNAIARKFNKKFQDVDIAIEDFKIHRAVILNTSAPLMFFTVTFLDQSGSFEIEENKTLVSSGRIQVLQESSKSATSVLRAETSQSIKISGEDIYNELRIFGYEYGPHFRRLVEVNIDGSEGFVEWNDNWITFLDALLLFFMFAENRTSFVLPTGALTVKICPSQLKSKLQKHPNKDITVSLVNFRANTMICRTEGVEIIKLDVDSAPQHSRPDNRVIEEYKFVPYHYEYFTSSKEKESLTKYMIACNKLFDDLEILFSTDLSVGKFRIDRDIDFDIDGYLNDLSDEQVLLHFTKNIVRHRMGNNLIQNEKEIMCNFYNNIGKDMLNTFLVNEYCLQYVFDIISENSVRKLKVMELNRNFPLILPIVVNCYEKYSSIKFTSKILVSDTSNVNEDNLKSCNIQLQPYEKLDKLTKEKSQDVVISSITIDNKEANEKHIDILSSAIADTGFIILFHKNILLPAENIIASMLGASLCVTSHADLEKMFESKNLLIVSKISDNMCGNLYVLKRSAKEKELKIVKLSENENWFEELKTNVLETADDIWLLSEDHPSSGIIGMVNCLRNEPGGDRLRCVFIPEKSKDMPSFDFSNPFYETLCKKDLLMNVWKDGSWGSYRHIKIKECLDYEDVNYTYLNIKRYGDLSSLEWMESPLLYAGLPEKDVVHICYSALNFKDIMVATGKLSAHALKSENKFYAACTIGLEFSGITKDGRRVAGTCPSMGIATAAKFIPGACIAVPDHWTLKDAATVPTVYFTCYYAMIIRGCLQPGESILIHSGTGGVGIAAINIALGMGCEIYTTVGNENKRKILLEMFPQINSENIGWSRNTSFENMIMRRTRGKGVDVVLNSLADEKFYASIRCVAKHGRFLEIGKYDLALDHKLGSRLFLQNITFHGVSLDQMFSYTDKKKNKKYLSYLVHLVEEGIKSGVVKPLKSTVFNYDETERAFRYMASGSHIGKVLLKIRDEDQMNVKGSLLIRRPSVPVTYFYTHKVYIIVGGLGGFGTEVARWLLSKGAKNIILTSRYGARTPYHQLCLKRWREEGNNVIVSTRDVSIYEECEKLLDEVSSIGPVGGIFNSAVVLEDAFLENCTMKGFQEVCAPKADATKNLDILSRSMCKELDHFVCFSSISCGRGNAGQMNYGYANSVMERICELRKASNLPGLAIQWGIIGEVGVVHRHMGDDAMIAGVGAQRVRSCLEVLDMSCKMKRSIICSYVLKGSVFRKGDQEEILQQLANIFGVKDISEFDPNRSFSEMGVDSMSGVELKNVLERACETTFTMKELQEMKIGDVKNLLDKVKSQKDKTVSGLVSTKISELPKSFIHPQAVQPLNDIKDGSPVFFMDVDCPDISQLTALGEEFNCPAFSLLWTEDTPTSDLETVAAWFSEKIKKMSSKEIHIVGNNSASVIVLEIVAQNLISEKNIKSFSTLNGSSYLIKVANETDKRSDNDILMELVKKCYAVTQSQVDNLLSGHTTLEDKIQVLMEEIFTQVPNKVDFANILESTVKKTQLLNCYKPAEKIIKDLVMIEDASELLANDIAEVKSQICKICSGKVTIHRVAGVTNLTKEGIPKIVSHLNSIFEM